MRERKNRKSAKRKSLFFRMTVLAIPLVLLLVLSQTTFAKNTYVITDGDRVLLYTSSETDPAEVLHEAGLALGEDDTYTAMPGFVVSEITVRRSCAVSIQYGTEVVKVSSKGETVGQLLERLNIEVKSPADVSASLDQQVYDGLQILISRTDRAAEVYTAVIPYETVYCYDSTLPAGTKTVVTPGKDGQILCNANVVYVDGKEVSRTVTEQTVIQQPVKEVVAVGTGAVTDQIDGQAAVPVIGDNTITLPTGEVLTFKSTMQVKATAYTHTDPGCDMITATGTTVHIGTVAVDPKLIPYGTRMFIVANDGSYIYGISTAEDCGGAIKGKRIDLYYPTYEACIQFGVRTCTIYFLGES